MLLMTGEFYPELDRGPDCPGPFNVLQYRLDGHSVKLTRVDGAVEVCFNRRSLLDGRSLGDVIESYTDDEVSRIGVACMAGTESDWVRGVLTLEHCAITSLGADPFTTRARVFDSVLTIDV